MYTICAYALVNGGLTREPVSDQASLAGKRAVARCSQRQARLALGVPLNTPAWRGVGAAAELARLRRINGAQLDQSAAERDARDADWRASQWAREAAYAEHWRAEYQRRAAEQARIITANNDATAALMQCVADARQTKRSATDAETRAEADARDMAYGALADQARHAAQAARDARRNLERCARKQARMMRDAERKQQRYVNARRDAESRAAVAVDGVALVRA